MAERKCFLRAIDATHAPIELLDNTPRTIGRGPVTKIKDSRCSRTQVLLVADFASNLVRATQLGRNSCAIDHVEMKKDKQMEIRHGQRFDLLLGQYAYILQFDPPPGEKIIEKANVSSVNEVSDSDDEVLEPPAKQPRPGKPLSNPGAEHWVGVENDSDVLVYKPPGVINSARIAAYDLDNTIISTKGGTVFPKNHDDWRIMHSEILIKLAKLHEEGYKIVIFTNQAKLGSGSKSVLLLFMNKIVAIVKKLIVPVEVYIARDKNHYRKPCTGMWDAMVARNGGIDVSIADSFYCGDAAGRTPVGSLKGDFSQADILFARNIGLQFFTPEEHFMRKVEKRAIKITAFDVRAMPSDVPLCDPEFRQILHNRQELVLLVGCPGSGKSHFFKTHMQPEGYKRVNRDELGTTTKCLQLAEALLKQGEHVVIDNTNCTAQVRAKYLELAKNLKVPARAFVMNTSLPHAKHNNKFRAMTDKSHEEVGDIVINTYFRNYEAPRTDEGFTELVKINFWPVYENPEHERLYKMFLTEK